MDHNKDCKGDCLLYTSDAADDLLCVDLGGRRIIKKKNITQYNCHSFNHKYKYFFSWQLIPQPYN